jgi:hypothetical protein
MIPEALFALLILEAVWAVALLVLLAFAMASRFGRRKRSPAARALRTAIQRALAVYVGGNTGLAGLQSLAAAHPEEFRNSIREFQGAVAGRCEAVGELAFRLGLVSRWCDTAQSGSPAERRNAFSLIAAVAPYAPVYRLAGDLARRAIDDPDEQVRMAAARLLLHSGDPLQIASLFERLLSDTPLVRILIGPELRVYAGELCKTVVPEALGSANPGVLVNALNLATSWERGLPLAGFGRLAVHPDAAVRLSFVRLLPLLPAGLESRQALLRGLADKDPRVHAAAVAAAGRLKILPDPDLVCAGGVA